MKVLVVGPDRQDPGGVANYYNAVFPKISDREVTAHYLEIGSTRGRGRGLHIVQDQLRFWRTIGQLAPDLIHLNPSLDIKSFLRDGAFIFLAKLRRKPVLVFFRGWQQPFETTVADKLLWFFKLSYGRADAFIVLANAFAERLRAWGISAPIALGATAVADELLENFSIDAKIDELNASPMLRLLYLARLEREKGVLQLLEAVKTLLQRGLPITLTIAGDGPVMADVRRFIEELGEHRDRIEIVGYVRGQAKIDILRGHHVYCFPTQYGEGMPNSVLEAMAFGMALVTCPVGGIADFFENGRMGTLIEQAEPEMIANAIADLIADRAAVPAIALYNYRFARQRFMASSAAEFLRSCYKRIKQV